MFLGCSGEGEKGDREGGKFRCYRKYVESMKEGWVIFYAGTVRG